MTDAAHLLAELSRALPHVRASAEAADRIAYARDLWPRHHLAVRAGRVAEHRPGAIVWPTSTNEVKQLVRWAHGAGVPLVPFGAGSGVCAGILPREDVVVVDLKRLGRIRSLDPAAPTVTVEAGFMGVPFEEEMNRRGFTLGHFPSSILCSTVGGWVAARSAGQCSGRYGKIEDMVVSLEVVTGDGTVLELPQRLSGPSLAPLVIGSEGTLGIVTAATLRLHPAPKTRVFASYTFPSTVQGMKALRILFQSGLRPAVSRLYDPFDAMMARRGAVKNKEKAAPKERTPGLGAAALRELLRHPGALEEILDTKTSDYLFGGALLVLIFEGEDGAAERDALHARSLLEGIGGRYEGEGHGRRWFQHRYAVSYRQAPLIAAGVFVDTMEVAAPWSKLEALYDGVRHALGEHVFVMAHFSHAYPDGCCIYFSFAGSASKGHDGAWDEACERTYDRAWRAALAAAVEAGGTLAHHHGVGRSKAPRLAAELGTGVDVVRAAMRAFDPAGIMNPGNLLPEAHPPSSSGRPSIPPPVVVAAPRTGDFHLDAVSQLVDVDASLALDDVEGRLLAHGFTLAIDGVPGARGDEAVGTWLAAGAAGARRRWDDPADQLLAGFDATLPDGRPLVVRPAPRKSVGPDLLALVLGQKERFLRVTRVWLRTHRRDVAPVHVAAFTAPPEPPVSPAEETLFAALRRELGH